MESAKVTNSFSHALKEIGSASKESVSEVTSQAAEAAKEAAREVDQLAHKNPWYLAGGMAALGAAIGFYAGRKLKP